MLPWEFLKAERHDADVETGLQEVTDGPRREERIAPARCVSFRVEPRGDLPVGVAPQAAREAPRTASASSGTVAAG